MNHQWSDVQAAATSMWPSILSTVGGLGGEYLRNKHGPCPMCGGKDRYRFDDKDGSGSYLCNACGSGYGIDLLQKYAGLDFGTAVNQVGEYLRLTPAETIQANKVQAAAAKGEPKGSKANPKCAEAVIVESTKQPMTGLAARYMLPITSGRELGDRQVFPVYRDGKLVNAALVGLDRMVEFAAGAPTFGGYTKIGDDTGKSVFITVDIIDAMIVHAVTGCQVLCMWSVMAAEWYFHNKETTRTYWACNYDHIELTSAELCGARIILPDHREFIYDPDPGNRAMRKGLFDPAVVFEDVFVS